MQIKLDDLDPGHKRKYVLVGVTFGLVLSTLSSMLRIWAKFISTKKLQREDWAMFAALFFSVGVAACLYYGLQTGLGQHEDTLTKLQIRNFLIDLWVIQRLQTPAIFCVKTSIILFYVRIFPVKSIRTAAWFIWIYTLLWLISIWTATLFECRPVQYFWDKTIAGGECIENPLITIGLTSGVLSCVGDIFIFAMPMPIIKSLKMNPRKKVAVTGIFMLGLFVIATSFVRWVALLTTSSDVTSNQVEAGVWTYLEISIGITCGNLPVLLPLFRFYFGSGESSRGYRGSDKYERSSGFTRTIGAPLAGPSRKRPAVHSDGFTLIEDSPVGSEIELQGNRTDVRADVLNGPGGGPSHHEIKPGANKTYSETLDGRIRVNTRVDVEFDDLNGDGHWGRGHSQAPSTGIFRN